MKLLFDLLPLLLFFAAYKTKGIYPATGVLIAATGLQIAYLWLAKKKVEKMYIITFVSVLVLGGLTLALHNDKFLKMKPTIVNLAFAVVFAGAHVVGKQVIIVADNQPDAPTNSALASRTFLKTESTVYVTSELMRNRAEFLRLEAEAKRNHQQLRPIKSWDALPQAERDQLEASLKDA